MKNETAIHITKEIPLSVETEIKVNTYDIDVAGHVNNIVYLRWLEDLRGLLFEQICPLEKVLELNYYPVVVSTEMRYKKQITLFDKPAAKMTLESYSHGIIVLKASISINTKLAFNASQKCVLMNIKNQKMFTGSVFDLVKDI